MDDLNVSSPSLPRPHHRHFTDNFGVVRMRNQIWPLHSSIVHSEDKGLH